LAKEVEEKPENALNNPGFIKQGAIKSAFDEA